MEGVGSRLGRASSRYGPAPVFSGPVRKWKRQWVHVSSSHSSHQNTNSTNNAASTLLLCRWTPIPSNNSAENSLEPPKRKFRYTPIVVLEEKKKGVSPKAEDERSGSKINESFAAEISQTDDIFDKTDIDNLFNEEPQGYNDNESEGEEEDLKRSEMDLDLRLKGHGGDGDSDE